MNEIDKLDGMVKIKGKCGYEIIGGCSDLRRLKQENKKLKELLETRCYNEVEFENKKLKEKLEKIKEIASKYSQREDYLLGGLFTDLVDYIWNIIEGAEE